MGDSNTYRGRAIFENYLDLAQRPDVARHPQDAYRDMERDGPVLRGAEYGVLVRTARCVHEVLRNPAIFASGAGAMDMQTERPVIPLMIDPPDHKKYRKLLDPLFAPRRMAQLEESVTHLVNSLIDGFVDNEEVDFGRQFSVPFPSQVFLALFGLPLGDLPRFLRWKDGILHPDVLLGHPQGHPDVMAEMRASAAAIYAYLGEVLVDRASQRGEDLVSYLLDAEVEGDQLTRDEILDICFTLFNAGLDTVSASLDSFFLFLAEHPQHRRLLVKEPELLPGAIEELLRWETPVMQVLRGVTSDTQIDGCPIKAGEFVSVMLGAANIDETEFPSPFDVDFRRAPNRHYSFGAGIHRCLGSHLARLELRVALREWHLRLPEYRLKDGLDIKVAPTVRSMESLILILE